MLIYITSVKMEIVFRNKELQDLARGIGDHKYPTGI
nr:MAG TPA: hypothetical protein [Caudoviricetes sp.]